MLSRLISASVIVLVLLAAALSSLKFWVQAGLDAPMDVPADGHVLDVAPGSTLSQLSRELAAAGFIDSPYPLLLHIRASNLSHIHAGEYQLSPGDSPRRLLAKLVSGDVIRYQITFPEGRTLRQWLQAINGHDRLGRQPALDMDTLAEHFRPPWGENLEGWFFPDTYVFDSRDTGLSVLRQAHDKMVETLEREWRDRSAGLPLNSPYEALILASIIEKETGVAEERPTIAGVFTRRLQRAMRLQTDPTVIYGLGEDFDGNLTRAHLREENPYNTYMIARLPPTPIANPGRESIRAALHPADGTALYFVARGDGSHHFSSTLEEHNRAVRKYQLQRAENYRSAPR